MIHDRLKKSMASIVLAGGLIMGAGVFGDSAGSAPGSSVASAQRRSGWNWQFRVRRLDRDHRIRYRMNNRVRVAGYYDRYGRFHAFGFYDRFGRFHRY